MNVHSASWRAGAVGGPDFSHLNAIFLVRIRYPLRDEPIVKHDEPKFCNGQYRILAMDDGWSIIYDQLIGVESIYGNGLGVE